MLGTGASAYWSAIAEQTDAAKELERKGVHGVMPADVSIPLSARDYPGNRPPHV